MEIMEDVSNNNPVEDVSGNAPIETTPSKEEITVSGNDVSGNNSTGEDVSGSDASAGMETGMTVPVETLSEILSETKKINYLVSALLFVTLVIWIDGKIKSAVRNVVRK